MQAHSTLISIYVHVHALMEEYYLNLSVIFTMHDLSLPRIYLIFADVWEPCVSVCSFKGHLTFSLSNRRRFAFLLLLHLLLLHLQ